MTVNGTPHPIAAFDVIVWVDDTTGSVTFGYAGTVAASAGKQYVLTNSGSLPSSPITGVTSAVTVTGTYKTQWQITFKQTGIGGDTGSSTVVTVAGSPKVAGDVDYTS